MKDPSHQDSRPSVILLLIIGRSFLLVFTVRREITIYLGSGTEEDVEISPRECAVREDFMIS